MPLRLQQMNAKFLLGVIILKKTYFIIRFGHGSPLSFSVPRGTSSSSSSRSSTASLLA